MGFPVYFLPWNADRAKGSQVAGSRDHGAVLHPIVWLRWRIAVRRHGPYAPDFDEFRRRHFEGS